MNNDYFHTLFQVAFLQSSPLPVVSLVYHWRLLQHLGQICGWAEWSKNDRMHLVINCHTNSSICVLTWSVTSQASSGVWQIVKKSFCCLVSRNSEWWTHKTCKIFSTRILQEERTWKVPPRLPHHPDGHPLHRFSPCSTQNKVILQLRKVGHRCCMQPYWLPHIVIGTW